MSRHPVSVLVDFSESNLFTPRQSMPFAEFERRASQVAFFGTQGGYYKTHIHVTLNDGEIYTCRLDLGIDSTLNFADHIAKQKAFARSDRGAVFIAQYNLFTLYALVDSIDCDDQALTNLRAEAAGHSAATKEKQRIHRLACEEQAKTDAMNQLKNDPKYNHLTAIGANAGVVEVLKNIRADLKKHFPGVKFSVKKSACNAARITWTDGPTEAAVKAVVGCYKVANFDVDRDETTVKLTAWANVFGAIEYISTRRQFSDSLRATALTQLNTNNRTSFSLDDLKRTELRVNGYNLQLEFNRYCNGLARTTDGWQH